MNSLSSIEAALRSALSSFQSGDANGAEQQLKAILRAQPRLPAAVNLLGRLLAEQGRFREAEPVLRAMTKLAPNSAGALYNHAIALQNIGRNVDALEALNNSIRVDSRKPTVWMARGAVFADLGQYENAIRSFDTAISLDIGYFQAYANKSDMLRRLRRFDEALMAADVCLRIDPASAPAWHGRARVLLSLGRLEEALLSIDRAIALDPNVGRRWVTRAEICSYLLRYEDSIRGLEKALSLDPSLDVEFELIKTKLSVCDWSSYREDFDRLRARIGAGGTISAFAHLRFPFTLREQLAAARAFVRDYTPRAKAGKPLRRPDPLRKIRLAYLSGEFRAHPTSFLLAGVLDSHDKSRFETLAFSSSADDDSAIRRRLTASFDRLIDVHQKSDDELSSMISASEIDILIYVDGYNAEQRPHVLAARPAPIQVNYLGWAGTMGADFMDYIVADGTVIGEESKDCYAEKIVFMPHSFLPSDSPNIAADVEFSRSKAGLPETGFVFCSFNANSKFNPEGFDGWARILSRCPDSVLWLRYENDTAVANLRREVAARGLDPNRLVFAKHATFTEHVARHRLAGLFLDSLPYNAHATANDALSAGLPVLTRIGETFAGRVAASLLNAVGLPELIVTNASDYEDMAVALATDPGRLGAIRGKLDRNRLTAPLFDVKLYTRHLEAAFEAMHARRLANLPPADIDVPA
jgi:predicted O-linked N-acetylglucosamine transferase (SPINDLY family)